MKKEKFKLRIAFSMEAQSLLDDHAFDKLEKSRKVRKGYDWDNKEFASEEARDAYIQGLKDGNGWSNEPYWEKI
jgi:hypothetical protein